MLPREEFAPPVIFPRLVVVLPRAAVPVVPRLIVFPRVGVVECPVMVLGRLVVAGRDIVLGRLGVECCGEAGRLGADACEGALGCGADPPLVFFWAAAKIGVAMRRKNTANPRTAANFVRNVIILLSSKFDSAVTPNGGGADGFGG